MNDWYAYIALLDFDDNKVSISFPDLPGCYSTASKGDNITAIKNAKEALALHIFGMEQDGDAIPYPTELNNIKTQEGEMPVLIEVFMPPYRDRIKTRFVKKTLSLPAWLAAKADEANVNCSKIFQNALIQYLGLEDK